jgi:hypothetical protein
MTIWRDPSDEVRQKVTIWDCRGGKSGIRRNLEAENYGSGGPGEQILVRTPLASGDYGAVRPKRSSSSR